MAPGTSTKFGTGKEMANEANAELLKAKAAIFLKACRDSGGNNIGVGPEERLRLSLSLTAGHDIPEEELHIWQEEAAFDRWPRAYLGAIAPKFSLCCIAGLIENEQSRVEVSEDGYWRFAGILGEMERKMIYMDPRANNYYQYGGRSCVNGPLNIRRMWRWLNDPVGIPPGNRCRAATVLW